jgi:hypothetical protein
MVRCAASCCAKPTDKGQPDRTPPVRNNRGDDRTDTVLTIAAVAVSAAPPTSGSTSPAAIFAATRPHEGASLQLQHIRLQT